ncbi:MAG: hypothetical protein ACK4ZM_00080 [bacterium]
MTLAFSNVRFIKISLASPQRIRELSYGEVKKPETKNYKTFRPERDGLFCEKIFGPERDYECACGKYKRKKIKTKGIICDKCGVEVTKSDVRRERMGHIELSSPVVHFWFLQGNPGVISTLLDLEDKQVKEVVYFESFVCTDLDISNINKLKFLVKLGYINKRRILLGKLGEVYNNVKDNEVVDKAFEFVNKVGEFLIENSPLFQMDSKKIEKLEKKLEEDYAFLTKKLYTEAKKDKNIMDFIKIFESIEYLDKGRYDKGYKGYLEIQRLLYKIDFKEIFKNEEKELLYETEKYEKERVILLNMLINVKEEIEKIVSISLEKINNILLRYKSKAEVIERTINLDIGAKLSSLKDKNIYKKIRKNLDIILKSVIYPFISNIQNLLDNSKNYSGSLSFVENYKFTIKDFRKMLNDCNEVLNDLPKLEEDYDFVQENLHLVRELKNLSTEMIDYSMGISEVSNILEMMENLKKMYSKFDKEVVTEVKDWKENYNSVINEYEQNIGF